MSDSNSPAAAGYDFPALVDGLNRYLRLRSIPIGMKRFKTKSV